MVMDVEDEIGLVWFEFREGVGYIDDGQCEDEEEEVGSDIQRIGHVVTFFLFGYVYLFIVGDVN